MLHIMCVLWSGGALWSKVTASWARAGILGSFWTVQLSLESRWAKTTVALSKPSAITSLGAFIRAHQLKHSLEHTSLEHSLEHIHCLLQ
ncbi:hypothetical protein U1Q18_015594 [Sarracenia purpurea var. burkii]